MNDLPPEGQMEEKTHNQPEFSVTDISNLLKRKVEESFSHVRVRGEVSGFKRASSGHLYFNLKDEGAVLNAICWKGVAMRLNFQPEDGMEVIATGKLSTFPGRSNYQMIAASLEPSGEGALLALLEKQRKQFEAEGLFAPERKKKIPYLPRVIGVLTSATGSVFHDIMHRIEERCGVHVILCPVPVQGEGSAERIARAIRGMNSIEPGGPVPRPDVLIVGRGGGSLEDLWPFNEEPVVRATAESEIPIISAVGHEPDYTLIDYAADVRAPTPTGAAEIAVPVKADLIAHILKVERRLLTGVNRLLDERGNFLKATSRGLVNPQQLLETAMQRLDSWAERFTAAFPALLEKRRQQLLLASSALQPETVKRVIDTAEERLHVRAERLVTTSMPKVLERAENSLTLIAQRVRPDAVQRAINEAVERLEIRVDRLVNTSMPKVISGKEQNLREVAVCLQARQVERVIETREQKLASLSQLLESYHYKKVLERGFALVRDEAGQLIPSASGVQAGAGLELEFHDGKRKAVVQ